MAMRENIWYASPYTDRISRNLGSIIFGDPSAARRREVQDAQIRNYDARTREVERKTAEARAESEALANMGSLFREALFQETAGPPTADGQGPAPVRRDAADIERRIPDVLGKAAGAYRDKPGAMGEIFRVMGAMSGDDSMARRGMVAAGSTPAQHFALTPERADAISARDAREQHDRELAVENVREGGRNARHATTETRLGSEFTSRETRLGNQFATAEAGRNAREAAKEEGRTTREELKEGGRNDRADASNETRERIATNAEDGRQARHDRPRGGAPKPPPRLSPKDAALIEDQAFAGIGGTPDMKAAALSRLSAEERAGLNAAIAEGWAQSSGNAAVAAKAGSDYLGGILQLNKNEVEGIGSIFNAFRGPSLDRQAPAVPPAAAPPVPANPEAQRGRASIPPVEQRVPGQVYDTPRGKMIWTGTGWKFPAAGGA